MSLLNLRKTIQRLISLKANNQYRSDTLKTIVSLKDEVFSEYASAIEARRVAYSEALEQDVLSCYAACKNDPIKTIVEYTREFDQSDFTLESIYLDLEYVDRWVRCWDWKNFRVNTFLNSRLPATESRKHEYRNRSGST